MKEKLETLALVVRDIQNTRLDLKNIGCRMFMPTLRFTDLELFAAAADTFKEKPEDLKLSDKNVEIAKKFEFDDICFLFIKYKEVANDYLPGGKDACDD